MVIETILNEHRVLHESDAGLMLRQVETGVLYESAEDNIPCMYSYEETDEPVPADLSEAEAADYEAALARLGVSL